MLKEGEVHRMALNFVAYIHDSLVSKKKHGFLRIFSHKSMTNQS